MDALPLPYLWLIAALLLALGEVFTSGFVLLWFALGAVAAAGTAALGGGTAAQLASFAASSLTLFAFSRTLFRDVLFGHGKGERTNVDAMIGKRAEVIAPIGPGSRRGAVRINGEIWDATCEAALPPGTTVTVDAIEGLSLHVHPLQLGEKT